MNRNTWGAISATAAVLAVLALGFRFLGSPAKQRLARTDAQDVQALSTLSQRVDRSWHESNHTLPENLDRIPDTKKVSVNGRPFVYDRKEGNAYELCATFATDDREDHGANSTDFWLHPQGDYCFTFDASNPAPQAPYPYPY